VCTPSVGLLTARDSWQAQSCTSLARDHRRLPSYGTSRQFSGTHGSGAPVAPGPLAARAARNTRQALSRDVHPRGAGASSG
jgi:hypothetical protein